MSIQERDYMRKGPDWEHRLRASRKRRRLVQRWLWIAVAALALIVFATQASWAAGDVEWYFPYLWNQPIEYILAGLLVLVVLGWPLMKGVMLKWRNRRTRRAFEKRQERQWQGHRRK